MHVVILYMRRVDSWWTWPKTLWQHGQLFAVLTSTTTSHCHPATGVLNTDIWLRDKTNREWDQARVSIYISSFVQCHAAPLDWVTVTKSKITKVNSESLLWLSTKISTPENLPPYGICGLCNRRLKQLLLSYTSKGQQYSIDIIDYVNGIGNCSREQ